MQWDLQDVPFPVSASPLQKAPPGTQTFSTSAKYVLWGYGLFGESQPDVKGKLIESAIPCAAVADFRVSANASFHDWLITHLTLGLVRMKTVTITGTRLPARG
jgi:hypothetical protein